MAPKAVIMLLFLAAFIMAALQYVKIDPRRRVLNIRFAMMAWAAVGAVGYPSYVSAFPGDRPASWVFLTLGVLCLAIAYHLSRRMPPREDF